MEWLTRTPRPWLRALVTLLLVGGAALLRTEALPGLGTSLPYATFYPAILLAALYGGLLYGIAATAGSVVLAACFIQDASVGPLGWLGRALFVAAGVVISVTCDAIRDSRSRLEASEARFRAVIDASPVPMAMNDGALRITLRNPAFVRTFGYTEEEVPTVADWWPRAYPDPAYRRQVSDAWMSRLEEAKRTGAPFEPLEAVARTREGVDRTVVISASPLAGKFEGEHLVVLYDISDLKRTEDELRRLNVELETRVAARTAELEKANAELEAFAYSVSHDLRAPLRAIEGFAGMVAKDGGERLDSEDQRRLEVVRTNARRMSALIDDLLTFSRTGRADLRRGRLVMKAIARSTFEEVLADPNARARVDFRLGDLPDADGDSALVRQVWINLLSNAVKFSARRESPVIEVTGSVEGEMASYHVKDNGVGFDQKYVEKLFGVFQRLHGATEFEGTGIGLALVRRIVEKHGGRIRAEGEVDRGATISFTLPRTP